MPPPMPLQVHKGDDLAALDDFLVPAVNRYNALLALRKSAAAWDSSAAPEHRYDQAPDPFAVMGGIPQAFVATHLNPHWFGIGASPDDAFWTTLDLPYDKATGVHDYTQMARVINLSDPEAALARELFHVGWIEALETSLGLGDGDVLSFTKDGKPQGRLKRNLPIDTWWVCGKTDGFDMEIAWNARQVTVFLLTPPLKYAPGNPTPLQDPDTRRRAAKRGGEPRGVVSVRRPDSSVGLAGSRSRAAAPSGVSLEGEFTRLLVRAIEGGLAH